MKALRKLRNVSDRANGEGGPGLTAWEKEFVDGVTGRLETYGSAFRDPGKGRLEEALSHRQSHVARAIEKKTRKGKSAEAKPGEAKRAEAKSGVGLKKTSGLRRSEFKRKTPMGPKGPRVRDVSADMPVGPDPDLTPEENRAALRLVPGGKPSAKSR